MLSRQKEMIDFACSESFYRFYDDGECNTSAVTKEVTTNTYIVDIHECLCGKQVYVYPGGHKENFPEGGKHTCYKTKPKVVKALPQTKAEKPKRKLKTMDVGVASEPTDSKDDAGRLPVHLGNGPSADSSQSDSRRQEG